MITVHHLNNSRSQRILWMLEELELPYAVERYERDAVTSRAPTRLGEVHPLGKSPVITDGDVVVAETGAIIEYLSDAADGALRPAERAALLEYRHWLHLAEGSAMLPLLLNLYTSRLGEAAAPLAPTIAAEIKLIFDYADAHLAGRDWFAGDALSGADIAMSFPLEAAKARGILAGHPACTDFVARVHARPAYLRALGRDGDYAYGPG